MKVAVIGAGRNRNGIGRYIAKHFQENRADVVSVLGTTAETSSAASHSLKQYGISAAPYIDFDLMIKKEAPDIVVIASPIPTHSEYIVKSLEKNLHLFCEKPFIWPVNMEMLNNIFVSAEQKKVKVAMNSQWPFAIPCYEELCGVIDKKKAKNLFMRLSPLCAGKDMIIDSLPHALSILYFIFGVGDVTNLKINSTKSNDMTIQFTYTSQDAACETTVKLVQEENQPRPLSFGFNDKIVDRVIDMKNYEMVLSYGSKHLKMPDPLNLSVQNFLSAVENNPEPVIGKSHIIHTTFLLHDIYNASN